MAEVVNCPDCGSPLPPDAPQGECPRCLLRAAMESQPSLLKGSPSGSIAATRTTSGGGHFVPPSVAELQQRIPQYEILELIGQGGMGAVYKARQRGLERVVAIKILPFEIGPGHTPQQNAAFTERFSREARALALLSHPHIVTVHDFGQSDGLCYFVMEYVAGVNLRQAIQAGKMNPAEALAIVPQICEALQFAHDEGVVHRDIKPENILIDTRGRVKIADFGLAKLLGAHNVDGSLTGTQQVMGTLRYMAPEQMLGTKEVDHRADIFSLGVVFYELLTGELPIGRFAPPSKKAQVDARIDEVVLRALENEPAERYQHVSEMKTGVDEVVRSPEKARAPQPLTPKNVTANLAAAESAEAKDGYLGSTWHLVHCFALSLLTLWFVLYFGPPVITMIDGPDNELIKVGMAWKFGRNVQTIFSTIVVIFVGLLGGTAFSWWKYRAASLHQWRDSGVLLPTANTDSTPRLSATALWGAILAPLFLVTTLMVAGTVLVSWSDDNPARRIPERFIAIVLVIPGVIGLFSPFATTLLGALSISQIRHSKGQLYGLPLAVFDTLLFPLLLLDVVLLAIGCRLLAGFINELIGISPATGFGNMGPPLLTAFIIFPVVIALDIWLVRLTWRAAAKGLPEYESAAAPRQPSPRDLATEKEPRLSLAALWGALLTPVAILPIGLLIVLWFLGKSSSTGPSPTWVMLPVMCIGLPSLIVPFVTTLLGVLAIGNIRHSAGKLYGMPLAVFDALLFPLLLLDLTLVGVSLRLFATVEFGFISLLVIVPLLLVLNAWLIRLAWQAASQDLRDDFPRDDLRNLPSQKEPPPFRATVRNQVSPVTVVLLVLGVVLMIPLLITIGLVAIYFGMPLPSKSADVATPEPVMTREKQMTPLEPPLRLDPEKEGE